MSSGKKPGLKSQVSNCMSHFIQSVIYLFIYDLPSFHASINHEHLLIFSVILIEQFCVQSVSTHCEL